jgi:hypothetical protein
MTEREGFHVFTRSTMKELIETAGSLRQVEEPCPL